MYLVCVSDINKGEYMERQGNHNMREVTVCIKYYQFSWFINRVNLSLYNVSAFILTM